MHGYGNRYKYGSIISIVFFLVTTTAFGVTTSGYDPGRNTLSQISSLLIGWPQLLYSLTYLVKFGLDLGFSSYVFRKLSLSPYSAVALTWSTSVLLFGTLAYFTEARGVVLHRMIALTIGILWYLSEVLVAWKMRSPRFSFFTWGVIVCQGFLTTIFHRYYAINTLWEILYFLSAAGWMLGLVRELDRLDPDPASIAGPRTIWNRLGNRV